MLHDTMCGGKTSLQQPGDGWEEPEPKPEDILERYSLSFKAEEGSLSVHCSALKETMQYPGEVFLLGRIEHEPAYAPCFRWELCGLALSLPSVRNSPTFSLANPPADAIPCRSPLLSPQALCALFGKPHFRPWKVFAL